MKFELEWANLFGFGTVLYGSREKNPNDKSYITTGWIILLYFPIIPLRSYRVILGKQSGIAGYAQVQYESMVRVPLNTKQVINTYLLWYLSSLSIVLFFWLLIKFST